MFQQVVWNLGRMFDRRMLFLPVRNRGNVIGFAFGEAMTKPGVKQLIDKAKQLEQLYQLEFSTYLLDLKRHNPNVFNRIIKS